MRLLVSMGEHPAADPGRAREPVLVELDPDDGSTTRVARSLPRYRSGPDEHAELTGASLHGGRLWQATRTEVLWLDPDSLEETDHFSHPLFYDVHDVCPLPDGGFAVSAAGLDAVLRFDAERRLVRTDCLRAGELGDHFDLDRDWRAVPADATKPHRHHPNNLFLRKGELWATVAWSHAARSLDGTGRIELPEGPPHDGRLREGLLWFTTVSGTVVGVHPDTLERVVSLDLNELCDSPKMLGWCRGVEVDGDRMWVGLTMLRQSRHRELLRRWVRGVRGEKLPTRVLELDWRARRVVRTIELGNAAGGSIFAINAYSSGSPSSAL